MMSAHWEVSLGDVDAFLATVSWPDVDAMSEGSFAPPVAPFQSSYITSQSLLDLLEFWLSFLLHVSSGYSINSVPPSSNRVFKPSEGQTLFAGAVRTCGIGETH